jgi:PAS domain S-box-containing protein
VGTCQDVTEQRRAHDELRRERDFNDATLAVAGAPIIVTDADWRIVRFNRQSELLSGCREAEALGHRYDFLVPPEERARMRANIETAQAGQIVTQENHLIARSGERRLIRWSNQVLRDEAGAFTHLIAVGIDITEQRRAELALTAAEERFRRAFDEAPIGMALLSPDGVLRKANASLGVICGLELSELEGTRLDSLLPSRDVESLGRALSELAAGRQVTPSCGSRSRPAPSFTSRCTAPCCADTAKPRCCSASSRTSPNAGVSRPSCSSWPTMTR